MSTRGDEHTSFVSCLQEHVRLVKAAPELPGENVPVDPLTLAVLNLLAGVPGFEFGWCAHQAPLSLTNGRSVLSPVLYLLECGASPDGSPSAFNWCPPKELMTYGGVSLASSANESFSPVEVAALALSLHTDEGRKGDARSVIRLLLAHGATADLQQLVRRFPLLTAKKLGLLKKLKAPTVERATPLCPCGSRQPFELCHGHPDGVPWHPRMPCACNSGKRFAKCCQRVGREYRETLTNKISCFEVTDPDEAESLIKVRELGDQLQAANLMPDPFSSEHYEQVRRHTMLVTHALFNALSRSGATIDPGFEYALRTLRYDAHVPMPWPMDHVDPDDTIRRMHEWNILIDEYIAKAASLGDTREPIRIERECKVGKSGGPLYQRCANACGAVERPALFRGKAEPGTVMLQCRQCRVSYCSKECQRQAWKDPHSPHKLLCGKQKPWDQPALLPSQEVLRPILREVYSKFSNRKGQE